MHDGHGDPARMPAGAALGSWTLMVVATMLPWAAADARWLGFRVLPACRQEAIAAFGAAFLAAWIAAGIVALLATA
ncbi:MAG: hypothetical protein M3340_07465, partial [Actinomycetota bacterium]|nr:hypothetical protein [Actinomycetota bacterium]